MAASPYVKIKINGKTYSLHRYVYEQAHGPLAPGYVVHHVNHNKRDNRLENLTAMTYAEHARHHNDRWPREKLCVLCGESFEPAPTKRRRAQTCSRECFSELARQQKVAYNPMRKVTPEIRAEVASRFLAGERRCDLADEFGLSRATLTRLTAGLDATGVTH